MAIPTPIELINIIKSTQQPFQNTIKLGTISSSYTSGSPTVKFDGETIISTKTYPYLGGYTPVANDRVVCLQIGTAWFILGKIIQGVASGGNIGNRDISFFIPGDLFLTTGIISCVIGTGRTISKVRLAIGSAPTGSSVIIDIHKNGVTMFTTQGNRPTIVASATSGVSITPDITTLAEGDVLTIDIDQVGSTLTGTGLAITVMCV